MNQIIDTQGALDKLEKDLADIKRREELLLALKDSNKFKQADLDAVWAEKNRILSERDAITRASKALEKDLEGLERDSAVASEGERFINEEMKKSFHK